MNISKLISKKWLFLAAFILVINSFIFSQIIEPVKWTFKTERTSDNEAKLIFKAKIDKGWHFFSQKLPDGGPIPTYFEFEKSKDYKLIGNVTEPKGIEEFDNTFKLLLKHFIKEPVFTQKIKILSEKPFTIKGFVEIQCCDEERCIPPTTYDFEFKIDGTKQVTATDGNETKPDTLPNDSIEEKTNTSAQITTTKIEDYTPDEQKDSSLWIFFLLAFVGGLIAIVTPCVLPMIPMTVTFFMHNSENKAKGKFQAFIYGISIIVIYTAIGSIVSVTLGPEFTNWISTHWLPNIFFFLIFVIFAASFFGMFELTLPSWMVNKSDKQADKGGYLGAFFMALTLVLVSFSCTVPIVGYILVEAARGEVLKPIVGMLGFSLAFALPFTLFAIFPSWLGSLPKSGGWLNAVKVILGFLELALGLKFLSVADQTYHWGILDREVYLAFWIVIFFLMGVYLLGKLKFAHDSDTKHLSVPRLMLAIITFAFVVYLIPGMFGAPLKALSGYLPPQTSHDFDLVKIIKENSGYSGSLAEHKSSLCEKPKYSDFLHLPHSLEGYFDYEQGMACAKKLGKPVFIDFTGHGCVSCREMEANVWSSPEVLKRLRENYLIITLYVDDKTELPKSEWITSKYDGKVKKTVGKKYADYQISKYNVNAQPYYVLLDNEGELLVKPRAYNLDIEEFVKFLDKGLEEYKKRNNPS